MTNNKIGIIFIVINQILIELKKHLMKQNISTTNITVEDPRSGKYTGQPIPVILPVPIRIIQGTVTASLLVLFSFMLINQPAPTQANTTEAIASGVSEIVK